MKSGEEIYSQTPSNSKVKILPNTCFSQKIGNKSTSMMMIYYFWNWLICLPVISVKTYTLKLFNIDKIYTVLTLDPKYAIVYLYR